METPFIPPVPPSRHRPVRVVLDTNVCLDLFVFGDMHAAPIGRAMERGAIRVVIDACCHEEWLRVLAYEQFALDTLAQREVDRRLLAAFHWLDEAARRPCDIALPRCGDPDDQKFLELAYAAEAQWLISKDNELLKLARRTQRDAGFAVVTPQAWSARFTLV